MSTKPILRLDPSIFNYTQFELDLRKKMAKENLTIYSVSTKVLYRSEPYLSGVLRRKNMPTPVMFALCDRFGLRAKDYEIVQEPVIEDKPLKCEGWTGEISVNLNANAAAVTIFKDGIEKVRGRAIIFNTSDSGIMQAISYAAHMAYKLMQQRELEE